MPKKKRDIFFLYSGKTLDEDLTFKEAASSIDKSNKLMKVQAWDLLLDLDKSASLKKSNYIICPKCYQKARISIDNNYQICLYECKNNHKSQRIKLKDFEKKQLIDESKIICDICKKEDKSNENQNCFYTCCSCDYNLCSGCKNIHEKNHFIVDYEDKDFYCYKHNEAFICYCTDCKEDICLSCEKNHSGHEIITYDSIMPNIETSKKELILLKESIRNLRKDIKQIIAKLNYVIDNLNNYYNIYDNIINNADIKKKNYLQIQNINELKNYNTNFIKTITEITNDKNPKTKFKDLISIFERMESKPKRINNLLFNFDGEFIGDENNSEESKEEEEQEDKKNKNEENKEDKLNELIEEENYKKNLVRYNPSDNKYEDLDLNNLKEIKSFEAKYDIEFLMVLHDRRLLVHQQYSDEQEKEFDKICIYDLSNSITICDINYDSEKKVNEIYQMNDDNVIICVEDYIKFMKIFKIKKKSMEEIAYDEICGVYVYQILDNKFITFSVGCYSIYQYEEGHVESYGDDFEIDDIDMKILCGINKNEIAIYYNKDGKIYGKMLTLNFMI